MEIKIIDDWKFVGEAGNKQIWEAFGAMYVPHGRDYFKKLVRLTVWIDENEFPDSGEWYDYKIEYISGGVNE